MLLDFDVTIARKCLNCLGTLEPVFLFMSLIIPVSDDGYRESHRNVVVYSVLMLLRGIHGENTVIRVNFPNRGYYDRPYTAQ